MRIALFDSGLGGITVLKEAMHQLPSEDFLYYADTQHVPYGTKPKERVREIVFDAVEFIARQDIKALVVACNTATSIAVRDLRSKYNFPIVGMEPAVKPALEVPSSQGQRILVFATPLTLMEEKFHRLVEKIDEEHNVDFLPLPELVDFAETFSFNESTIFPYLSHKLSKYDLTQYKAVVLGCTHFVLFKSLFRRFLPPHIHIVDGNAGTVTYLKRLLVSGGLTSNDGSGNVLFYTSGIAMEENMIERIHNDLFNLEIL